MNLIIVESPTKAKTISRFLGSRYQVASSFGHVRDLPKSKMGIDIEHGFAPHYVIPSSARKIVNNLKAKAQKAQEIILASDEDREGEAIAWHLKEALKLSDKKTKRITFHEITPEAIQEALQNPRQIDLRLVDAQQARRILDRLVGYELSPFLWKKVARGLSAGRVQSVALRLIVEREEEIKNFQQEEYWTIEAVFGAKNRSFSARLVKIDDKKLEKFSLKNKEQVDRLIEDIKKKDFVIEKIDKKQTKKTPPPPFITSTLQQEANNKLGFSAKKTMLVAQQLYEGVSLGEKGSTGLITYMRTDSVNLSAQFLEKSRQFIKEKIGKEYLPSSPRRYKTRQKAAQEAHEAIRPTDVFLEPGQIKEFLTKDQFKLYELIWRRSLACQMKDAQLEQTKIDVSSLWRYLFRATGKRVVFPGFLKLYPEKKEEKDLPFLQEKEKVGLQDINGEQHFTEPLPRYSDATLVKTLESYGIGRPSTYAPTIHTLLLRGYVEREGKFLKPREIAFLVVDLLKKHFFQIVDFNFTAEMEEDLDKIAQGEKEWVSVVSNFYFPFKANLIKKEKELKKKDLGTEEESKEVCEKCGSPMVVKMSRFGKFLACSNFPQCRNTKPLDEKGEIEKEEKSNEVCEKCGSPMVVKKGRFGKFLACSGYPECKNIKPLVNKTGVKCPQCGQGEIVERKSKKGRTFYACDKYPECRFVLWGKPTGEKCPQCGALLVYGRGETAVCSNKECGFKLSG